MIDCKTGNLKKDLKEGILDRLFEYGFLKQFSGFQFMAGVKMLNLDLNSPKQTQFRLMIDAKDAFFSRAMIVSYRHLNPV